MIHVTIEEAKARLDELLSAEGETIVVALDSQTRVQFTPQHQPTRKPRVAGSAAGLITVLPGFYDPIEDFEDDV